MATITTESLIEEVNKEFIRLNMSPMNSVCAWQFSCTGKVGFSVKAQKCQLVAGVVYGKAVNPERLLSRLKTLQSAQQAATVFEETHWQCVLDDIQDAIERSKHTESLNEKDLTILLKEGQYLDFQIPGINGVFRIADDDGNPSSYLPFIAQALDVFYVVGKDGASSVMNQVTKTFGGGNGWSWHELSHPELPEGYSLAHSYGWATSPYSEFKSLMDLYGIKKEGIKLCYSEGRLPTRICYFHPSK